MKKETSQWKYNFWECNALFEFRLGENTYSLLTPAVSYWRENFFLFSYHQKTPLDVAVDKGYDVIEKFLRETGRSEVSVRQYCWKYITGSIGDNLIPRPPMR